MTYTTIELHNFLRTRRSVRRFKPDVVPDSVLEAILSTAIYAPSAHNRQPWRFVIVTDRSVKTELAQAMAKEFEHDLHLDSVAPDKIQSQVQRSKERLVAAPVIILLCLDMSEMDSYSDARRQETEHTMAVQSVAATGLQLLLAVHAEGLGGVWVCSPLFTQETIRTTLRLNPAWEPQAMFYIGYAAQIPEPRERKRIQEISVFL